MNHHYDDIIGTMTTQLRDLHYWIKEAGDGPAPRCRDEIGNDGRCTCVAEPQWWDVHGTPRFCEHHPQHSADIYASEVALLRISCQGCGHEFFVQMTNGMWETAMEIVCYSGSDRIVDRLLEIANDAPREYAEELGKLTTEIAVMRAKEVPTLADLVRDGTIHYGDPPNTNCCMAGPTMNCWDLAVVEFWNRVRSEWHRMPELEHDLPDMIAADRLSRLEDQ